MKPHAQLVVLLWNCVHKPWQNCEGPVTVAEVCRRVRNDPASAKLFKQQQPNGETITFEEVQEMLPSLYESRWMRKLPPDPRDAVDGGETFSLPSVAATAHGRPEVGDSFLLVGCPEATFHDFEPLLELEN